MIPPEAPPFPVAESRFDHKNEMFKRSVWDESVKADGERFYRDIVYQEKPGYRRLGYVFRNGSGNLEESRGNFGLYSWDAVSPKLLPYLQAGPPVEDSPEESVGLPHARLWVGATVISFRGGVETGVASCLERFRDALVGEPAFIGRESGRRSET